MREEEERLASMPAWKRGIIQRRRAKQDGGREKKIERVREAGREFEPETVPGEPTWRNSSMCSKEDCSRKEMEKVSNEGKRPKESNYERMSGEKYNEREDNRGKWRDREIHMERTRERDIIEEMKESGSDPERGKKAGERDVLFPLIPGIHTIKAENIIIIENGKNQKEKVESDGERETDVEGKKRGRKMDLKEFLAGGEKMICVSEVLIIKPSIKEDRSKEDRKQWDDDEKKMALGVIEREEKETDLKRVSQLISKFGENCKFSCRSKSSDCFLPVEMGGEVRKEERKKRDREEEYRKEGSVDAFRGVPKRSFSFTERACKERRVVERSYSVQLKREIGGEVEKEEKTEDEREESENKGVNEMDRNAEISTFKGDTKRFREQNKQKIMQKTEKMSAGTEKVMEEIRRERNDGGLQHESMKIVKHGQELTPVLQSMVKLVKQGMSMTWNEAVQHRGEILIPRSVFYASSEQSSLRKDRDEIKLSERRVSWKAGRPLTRVESLKERIWQKERGGTEGGDKRTRKAEMESRQEVASPQSLSQFDVTREVSKEELPVCVPPSLSAERETSVFTDRHDRVTRAPEREKEREEDLWREDYILPSQSSSSSSSPSPPLDHTQPAMSRIYNLKPVTSRAGVCITERNLDVQTHSGGMIKIRHGGQFAAGPPKVPTEISSLRSVQRQVEQLHLKEQEVQRQNDGEAAQKQNACETGQEQKVDNQKSQTHTISKPSSESRVQGQLPQISTSTTKSINAQIEPTITAASTPLFTIRSASRGPGKRGTTITITPRKSGPSGTPSSSIPAPKVPPSSVTTPKAPSNMPELGKKRYPTVEEIEVIGGYQNLEKSCLVKNRGSPKMVRIDATWKTSSLYHLLNNADLCSFSKIALVEITQFCNGIGHVVHLNSMRSCNILN